jgi:hypothetical protein
MTSGNKSFLTPREKVLYHQIHPAKLSADIAAGLISLYLIWIHELALGILGGFVPSLVASAIVIRYANIEKYAASPFGRYLAKYMSGTMQAVRFGGLFVAWFGAWYHMLWIIGAGLLIVILAWFRGKLIPRRE